MTQIEYSDLTQGDRPLNYMLIYPAAPDIAATPFKVFLSTKLRLYKDAPIVSDGLKHPLVVFCTGPAVTARAMLGSVNTWRRTAIW